MKSFRFPLQRVLDWRALHLRSEEEKLAGLQRRLTTLEHRENILTAEQLKAELGLLGLPSIDGNDLRALAAYQMRIQHERTAIRRDRTECEAQVVSQRKRLLQARMDCRVLEQLKTKRQAAWTYLSDREVESTAAESYICGWLRPAGER